MIDFGTVKPGTTLFIPFSSYAGATGASVTLTGLATTDIEIYKDGSVTQRASDAGYALLDTDGIDFDAITGIHGFSIDLADNTTANFYASGSQYWVVVSAVTIDSQTVNFIAATFRIGYADAVLNTTIATLSSQTSFTLTAGPAEDDALNGCQVVIHDVASAVQVGRAVVLDYTGSTKTVTLVAGTTFTAAAGDNVAVLGLAPLQPTTTGRTLDVSTGGEAGVDWANVGSPTTTLSLSGTTVAAVTTVNGLAANVITATSIQNDAITDAKVASDVTIASVTGAVGSVTGNVGGNVVGSVASVTAMVTANVIQISGDTTAADNLESYTDGTTQMPVNVTHTGGAALERTLQAGGTTSITLAATESALNDSLVGYMIYTTGGTGAGQTVHGTAYNGTTKVLSGLVVWQTGATPATMDATTTYQNLGPVHAPDLTTELAAVQADTNDIQTRLPAALVSGRMDASVGAMAANVLTATAIAADAITDAKVASDVTIASVTGAVGSVTGNVGGNVTGSVGSVATGGITAGSFAADAITAAKIAADVGTEIATAVWASGTRTLTAGTNVDGSTFTAIPWNAAWDAEVQSECNDALIANNLDHLLLSAVDTDFPTTVHLNSVIGYLADNGTTASYDRTTDSLEVLGAATAPSAASIADAVWDEALSGHLSAGSTGEALNAAGAAGDPWVTTLPGAYGAGSAGHTVGTYLTGNAFTRLGAPAGASVSADVAAVKAETATILSDTNDIQTRIPATLVSGRMDASVGAMATDVITAAALNADAVTEIQSGLSTLTAAGVRTAVGLASANLDTQLDALPTAAEVTTAVWAGATRTLTALDEDTTAIDLDATIAAAAPTASAIATAWGSRVIGNGRTADMYLQGLTNRIAFAADGLTWTLYSTDDVTPLASGASVRLTDTVGGLRSVDPT